MNNIGKGELLFACRTDTKHLNVSIPLFLLNSNSGLGRFLSPEGRCLFELNLPVVNPKIDSELPQIKCYRGYE